MTQDRRFINIRIPSWPPTGWYLIAVNTAAMIVYTHNLHFEYDRPHVDGLRVKATYWDLQVLTAEKWRNPHDR